MKKLILLVCFLLVTSQSYSQLAIENFAYPADQLLTDHGWINIGGTGQILVATSPGLIYSTYIGSMVGNATTLILPSASAQDVYLPFTSQTSNSVYASFMVNVSVASTLGSYFVAYLPSTSTSAYNGRVYAQEGPNGGLQFGLARNSNSPVYTGENYAYNTTYLLVLKYTFNAGTGTDDEASLFVFSGAIPATEPVTPTIGPIADGTDAPDISRIALRQANSTSTGNTPTAVVDGIYVDVSWNNGVLPVELSSFSSVVNNRDVTLNWTTQTETNNSGFEIERSINGVWSSAGFVAGNGNATSSHNYSFTDRNLNIGTYNYRLKQIDYNGAFEYHNLNNEVIIGAPGTYSLSQNYPNPFNPSTVINYQLPKGSDVNITLYDVSGKEVKSLVNENQGAGYYSITLNASSLSSGIYFYTIRTSDFTSTKSMLLVK